MDEFEALFQTFSPMVYRFLPSLCGDGDLAEELTAETFYQAYLHIGKFRGDCKVETWLCQIAKNAFFKEQKRRKRTAGEPPEDLPVQDGLLAALEDKAQALEIHRRLHTLKEPYREVFMLRVFGELAFREIADIFGKTESWAKVTFYRAKDRLIQEMEDGHENEL